jgi:hypothetical protein
MIDFMFAGFVLLSLTLVLLIVSIYVMVDTLLVHKRAFRLLSMVCTLSLMGIYIYLIAFIAGLA